jgi:predicted dienelactone hydrolase
VIALLALAVAAATPGVCDAVWHDAARDRDIPVRISLPPGKARVPLIVASPGLGGYASTGSVWARHWAANGLAVVQMQHPGSDGTVYRTGDTPEVRRARVVAGTSPEQLFARVADTRFVLSELSRRRREAGCDLTRIDAGRAAIAGHSMGAWVAQGIAGQRFNGEPALRDLRFRAALALSPTAAPGTDAFDRISIPFLSITGSRDGVPDGATPEVAAAALAARSAVFRSLPADGSKCLVVVDGAEHMMLAGSGAATAPLAHHTEAVVKAASTAFLLAALAGEPVRLAETMRGVTSAGDVVTCK